MDQGIQVFQRLRFAQRSGSLLRRSDPDFWVFFYDQTSAFFLADVYRSICICADLVFWLSLSLIKMINIRIDLDQSRMKWSSGARFHCIRMQKIYFDYME